jgi:hypothetical protein
MNTTLTYSLLYWIPRVVFTLAFILVGIYAFKKRSIPSRLTVWLFIVFILECVVEIGARAYVTFNSSLSEGLTSFAYSYFEATFMPTLQSVIIRQLVMIGIAAALWAILAWYARKTKYQKIDIGDVNVFVFGVLIAGWPNFFIYIGLVFLFAIFGLLGTRIFKKNIERMIVTPYFVFAGIVIIFWGWKLSVLTGLYALR